MRKKLIILSLILIGCLGLNLLTAANSCAHALSPSERETENRLTATPLHDVQWEDLGLRHLLPAGYKTAPHSSPVARTLHNGAWSRSMYATMPSMPQSCEKAAILYFYRANRHVYRLLRLRL